MPFRTFDWLGNATSTLTKKKTPRILHAQKQPGSLFCPHRFKRVHCARASLRHTRLTCSVLSHACMQLIGHQKEACASTSLKQIQLPCLLQLHTQMPKKYCATSFWCQSVLRLWCSQRISKRELCRTNCETTLPLKSISFYHPQCIHNVVASVEAKVASWAKSWYPLQSSAL